MKRVQACCNVQAQKSKYIFNKQAHFFFFEVFFRSDSCDLFFRNKNTSEKKIHTLMSQGFFLMQEEDEWTWILEKATVAQLVHFAQLAGVPLRRNWSRNRLVACWRVEKATIIAAVDVHSIAQQCKAQRKQRHQKQSAHLAEKHQERDTYKRDWFLLERFLVRGMTLYAHFYPAEWYSLEHDHSGPGRRYIPQQRASNRRVIKMQLTEPVLPLLSKTGGPHLVHGKQRIHVVPHVPTHINWLSRPMTIGNWEVQGQSQRSAYLLSNISLCLSGTSAERPRWNSKHGFGFRSDIKEGQEHAGILVCNVDLNFAISVLEQYVPAPLALLSAEFAFLCNVR